MSAAKRKRENQVPTVYHHTSTLRTNLIWMAGVIEVEGRMSPVWHPQIGEIGTDAKLRRAMKGLLDSLPANEIKRCARTPIKATALTPIERRIHISDFRQHVLTCERQPVHAYRFS